MINFGIVKRLQPKARNRIGLDIGSSSVKMLEVSAAPDKLALVKIGFKKVSSAVRTELIEAIGSLAKDLNVSTKEANISVSGSSVTVRFISMPKMRDDELKGAIRFEAEKHIPFAIDDCIVDYNILRKNEKEGKFEILLVAAKKEFILDRIAIVEESGFSVNLVDVDTFSAANAFLKNNSTVDPDKTFALLNIGAAYTNVGIVRGGVLCFARDIAMGQEDAKGAANNLLDEIRLSFSYYENQSGKGVDEIYISGGNALFDDLERLVQETFESKPFFWDPLDFLDKADAQFDANLVDKMKGSFAVAAGLALR